MNNLLTILHVSWVAMPSFCLYVKISFMFINHDWRAHQAGLMAIEAIAEGTSNNILNILKNITQ